ncbi:MAG: Smr/MutS family protein, partial [Oscillospiraceae bacterium]
FEDVVSDLETTRQNLEREKDSARGLRLEAEQLRAKSQAECDRLELDTEKELERARVQARRIIEETRVHAEVLFEQLDAIKKEKDASRFSELLTGARQEYRSSMKELEQLSDPVRANARQEEYTLPRPLEKGDIVFVRTLGKEGLVLKTPAGSSVLVQAGVLKTTVPIADVMLGGAPKSAKASKKQVVPIRREGGGVISRGSREVKTELNLRGLDAEQAMMELDAFLDSALLSGVPSVRIIHGKGTGVLRAAVAQRLRSHRNIASFRLGRYGEGEDGVTIAELK